MPTSDDAIINAAAGMTSNAMNIGAQMKMNKRNKKWAEQRYEKERADALADWHMMNEYNSPAQQMKRFREAGLNPHLIYGQQNEGATVRSTDTQNYEGKAPQFDAGFIPMSLMMQYEIEAKQAQTNNMREMNKVIQLDQELRAAQIYDTIMSGDSKAVGADRQQFDLSLAEELRNDTIESVRLTNRGKEMDLDKTAMEIYTGFSRNEREIAMNSQSIRESAQRIISMRIQNAKTDQERKNLVEQLEILKKDNKLKETDVQLAKGGFDRSQNFMVKLVAKAMATAREKADKAKAVKEKTDSTLKADWKPIKSPFDKKP